MPKKKVDGWSLASAAARVLIDEQGGFLPSEPQIAFRARVMECWRQGLYLRHQWCDATTPDGLARLLAADANLRLDPWPGKPVTLRMLGTWDRVPGFSDWLLDEIRVALTIDGDTEKMVDLLWHEGVIRAMTRGEEWAYRAWAADRQRRLKGEPKAGEGQTVLDDFMEAATQGSWE